MKREPKKVRREGDLNKKLNLFVRIGHLQELGNSRLGNFFSF